MGADSLSGAFVNILYFVGSVAFTWVPATVGTVTGTAPSSTPPISLLSQPVTAPEALQFLQQGTPPGEYALLARDWTEFVAVSITVSILFAALVAYSLYKLREVRRHELEHFEMLAHPVAAHDIPHTQLRWNALMADVSSGDEKRWRLAILEADIMLNELLDLQGYRGETMADKMKQVDRAGFRTIDEAWEAHRVRNQIAHEGSARLLNEREVRRIMGLYKNIFLEFKMIE